MNQNNKYKNDKLNTFTIAHYILMFFVAVFCIGIVAWILARPAKTHKETVPSDTASISHTNDTL